MSHKLINHSPDLKKLRDEGLELEVKAGHLLVHVPYVNAKREVARGTLVSTLTLSSPERTGIPDNHVIFFIGEFPRKHDGSLITALGQSVCGSRMLDSNTGLSINQTFSNRPANGFPDYYEKITSYIRVICSHAEAIDPNSTPYTFKVIESTEEKGVFKYLDTNSSRAEINVISAKLEDSKIAIIGLGGTGSYVLDFVAKTPIKEIHLFDGDDFLQHNAFRAPGAPSVDQLSKRAKKVDHFCEIYSNMRKAIYSHRDDLTASNVELLAGMDFVFICIDDGETKKVILGKLLSAGIPFADSGIGVEVEGSALTGSVRVTTVTKENWGHVKERVPFSDNGDDLYAKNIQIAELNALNAALAVIKWKKLCGFYHDLEKEHHSVYEINTNQLINDEVAAQVH